MPQSLANVLVHIVFSTKERRALLQIPDLRNEMHRYMAVFCPSCILSELDVLKCGVILPKKHNARTKAIHAHAEGRVDFGPESSFSSCFEPNAINPRGSGGLVPQTKQHSL